MLRKRTVQQGLDASKNQRLIGTPSRGDGHGDVRPLLKRPIRLSVVALASPSDTPPAGSVGYYSDGAQHAAAVVISATGRRLFYEVDVDDVIRSNVIEYLYEDE